MSIPKLFVALDMPQPDEWLYKNSNYHPGIGFKVNLDAITQGYLYDLMEMTKPINNLCIFLDYKMNNGVRTMGSILRDLIRYDRHIIVTVHLSVGVAALKELQEIIADSKVLLFGVGALTHYDDDDTMSMYNLKYDALCKKFADITVDAGIAGMIVPGSQLGHLREYTFNKITPGIYVHGVNNTNQKHQVTPTEAYMQGAHAIVVGRAIYSAANPIQAAADIFIESNTARDIIDSACLIVNNGAVEIRADNEEPFVYSSGNRGPGYIMVKGLVGRPGLIEGLIELLVRRITGPDFPEFDFIAANATGGMIPGWEIQRQLNAKDLTIPFVYIRGTRKIAGHGELITGDRNNPYIQPGMKALIVEELVNYAETTCNSALVLREAGYIADHATCILSYDHEDQRSNLTKQGVTLHPLVTLPQVLEVARSERLMDTKALDSYEAYLADPIAWQVDRGLVVPEETADKAVASGKYTCPSATDYNGAPQGQVNNEVKYYRLSKIE